MHISHVRLSGDEAIAVQLVQSILDQSHLVPLTTSIQPVLADFDHTLRLYPLPTAVSSISRSRIFLCLTMLCHRSFLRTSMTGTR